MNSFSTYSLTDNGLEPIYWPLSVVDESLGAFRNGVSEVPTKAGESVLYLVIANRSGLFIFTGYFHRPELSWKISNLWQNHLLTTLNPLEVGVLYSSVNDPYNKKIFISIYGGSNEQTILIADYKSVEADLSSYAQKIKWSKWTLDFTHGDFLISDSLSGAEIFLIANPNLSGEFLVYEGTDYPPSDVALKTAVLRLPSESLLHLAAIRLSYTYDGNPISSGGIDWKLINVDETGQEIELPDFSTGDNQGITPTFITNFIAQRVQLVFNAIGDANSTFMIRRIISFVKEIYKTLPFQFNK